MSIAKVFPALAVAVTVCTSTPGEARQVRLPNSASTEYRQALHPLYHLVEILAGRGDLGELHRQLLVEPLPAEELYDLRSDPHEMRNLAGDGALAAMQSELGERLETWIEESQDLGFESLDADHVAFFEEYRIKQNRDLRKRREALRDKVLQAVLAGGGNRQSAQQVP